MIGAVCERLPQSLQCPMNGRHNIGDTKGYTVQTLGCLDEEVAATSDNLAEHDHLVRTFSEEA